MVNNPTSSVENKVLQAFLVSERLDLIATTNMCHAFANVDFVIICILSDYKKEKN